MKRFFQPVFITVDFPGESTYPFTGQKTNPLWFLPRGESLKTNLLGKNILIGILLHGTSFPLG